VALTRALVLLLILALPVRGQQATEPYAGGRWQEVDAALARAAPLPRAALLWTAWEVVDGSPRLREALAASALRGDSPLLRLPAGPPPGEVRPVADPWLRHQHPRLVGRLPSWIVDLVVRARPGSELVVRVRR
jgi:hypothetical protein